MDRALRNLVWHGPGTAANTAACRGEYDDTTFEIDHIVATSHRGPTRASNLCLACFTCNSFKGTKSERPRCKDTKDRFIIQSSASQVAPSLPVGRRRTL